MLTSSNSITLHLYSLSSSLHYRKYMELGLQLQLTLSQLVPPPDLTRSHVVAYTTPPPPPFPLPHSCADVGAASIATAKTQFSLLSATSNFKHITSTLKTTTNTFISATISNITFIAARSSA
ncbi:unnamed protein product [Rodentolepis nana]|uniref:Uncharacterized protein n=1 Tax=Rodentolepis nana TaxID=102285 RepID=A0A0R3TVY0_RODNA|nr:unnamed protein product [Rodentolepis nana]